MTAFLLQLIEFVSNGYFQLFLGLYVFSQLFWWLRVYLASQNKTYVEPFRGTFAVVVAVFQEDPELFEACLKSIKKYSKPSELIVTIDNASQASKRIKTIAKTYATTVIEMPAHVGKREQYAQAAEMIKKKTDVIVTVDSDTTWDETTVNILKPFTDELVGAVSGRQTITNPSSTWVRRVAEWLEDIRFSVQLPFQSYFGQVNVIPGRTLAARRAAFVQAAQFARKEMFMGRRMFTSDDASITMHVLSQGFRVVYQADSLVHTEAPNTPGEFFRQYVRWYRGSLRRFFKQTRQILNMHPLVVLGNLEFLLVSFIYLGIVVTFVFKLVFRVYEFTPQFSLGTPTLILLLILGFFASNYIRQLPHLIRHKRDFLFLPVFAVFSAAMNAVIKLAAAFSFSENGWLTRGKKSPNEGDTLRARTYALIVGALLIVITIPLAYVTDIRPYGVPLSVLVSQRGPEFYRAKQAATSLTDTDTTNDPSDDALAALITSNAVFYNHAVVHEIAHAAVPCARDALTQQAFALGSLDRIDTCYHQAVADAHEPTPAPTPSVATTVTRQAQVEDTLTYLVRAELKQLDTHNKLGAAQAVFVETTYLQQTNQQDVLLLPGDTVTIDVTLLRSLATQAEQLSPDQIDAWDAYSADIVW